MKIKMITVVLALTLLLSSNATASFFNSSPTLTQVFALVSKLSNDIGLMADRIVHTEELMVEVATQNSNSSSAQTVLISTGFQTVLYADETPNFTTNSMLHRC